MADRLTYDDAIASAHQDGSNRIARRVRLIDRGGYLRFATLFGARQSRRLARWIGTTAVIASTIAAISIIFPPAPFASVALSLASCAIGFSFGVVLLFGVFDHAPAWAFQIVIAVSTADICLGVFAGGSPSSGAQMFFLWISPLAFAFFSIAQAIAQVAWIALGYAVVLDIQLQRTPAIGSRGLLSGMWFIVIATVFVIGCIVRRISRNLREVDQRFQRAFEDSPIGSAFLSRDLEWIQVNDALAMMLERDAEALVGASWLAVTHPDDIEIARTFAGELDERTIGHDLRFLRPGGATISSAVSATLIRPEIGEPYVFMQFVDTTAHMADREALAHRAIHDPLTGLFNRTLLLDRLDHALHHRDTASGVAILMLDLDRFKVVNDSLGHHFGDQLLAALAPRLNAAVSSTDTLARFGGDEFVVLCEHVRGSLDAIERATALAEALSAPVTLSVGSYTVTGTVGVAIATSATEDGQSLLRDADAAMYRAKATGRNRVEVFNRTTREEAVARLELENDLRGAIERHEFELEFQPVVDLETGRPIALEALLRWMHPRRGRLEPREFIPLAEETGLISGIGDWVLESALVQLAEWQIQFPDTPPLAMTVNVSGRQLTDPDIAKRIAALLRTSGVAPRSLGIEITESVLLADDIPAQTLSDLKDLDVLILLDDFGTGYSSLAYLETFPIDVIKVDQAFVARIDEGPHRTAVLEAILAMATALELRVIAEGAENDERIEALRALGCSWVQGHGICRPLPVSQVGLFLAEQQAIAFARKTGGELARPSDENSPDGSPIG